MFKYHINSSTDIVLQCDDIGKYLYDLICADGNAEFKCVIFSH